MSEADFVDLLKTAFGLFLNAAAYGAIAMGIMGFLIGGFYLLFIDMPFRLLEIIKGR